MIFPIQPFLELILNSIFDPTHRGITVIKATPGSGKTTQVPLALIRTNKKVIVVQPRRIAAIGSARFVSQLNNTSVGREVGYQVRFDNQSTRDSKLIYMTDGIFLNLLSDIEFLKNIDCIILDEFHERSLSIDIIFACLWELQQLYSLNYKIVLMSATLDGLDLSHITNEIRVLDIPGQIFPMITVPSKISQSLRVDHLWFEKMYNLITQAYSENKSSQGSFLVFLPGKAECDRIEKMLLQSSLNNEVRILKIYGAMSLEQQNQVLTEPSGDEQRIILATNIAETSLTVPNVNTVIDSGLERVARWDKDLNFTELELKKISLSSAKQRAGRSARQRAGTVYLTWTKLEQQAMALQLEPEVQRSDLRPYLLRLCEMGVTHFDSFSWVQKPLPESLSKAKQDLIKFELVDQDMKLTSVGQMAMQMNMEFSFSVLLARAYDKNNSLAWAMIPVVIYLSEFAKQELKEDQQNYQSGRSYGDKFTDNQHDILAAGHLEFKIEKFKKSELFKKLSRSLAYILKDKQFNELPFDIWVTKKIKSFIENKHEFVLLWIEIFPERVFRVRKNDSSKVLLASGVGAKLEASASLDTSADYWGVALDLFKSRGELSVSGFIKIEQEELIFAKLGHLISIQESFDFNPSTLKSVLIKTTYFLKIPISEIRYDQTSQSQKNKLIKDYLLDHFELIIDKNSMFNQWVTRYQLFIKNISIQNSKSNSNGDNENFILSVSDIFKLATEQFNFNDFSDIEDILTLDWPQEFEKYLNWDLRNQLNRDWPSQLALPNGKSMAIEYTQEGRIQSSVYLRDLFGLSQHPFIGGQALALIILGPHGRPIQITSQIEQFWNSSYIEIKKELKGRYPKQPWPDDPTHFIYFKKVRSNI